MLRLVVLGLTTILYFASSVLFGWQYVRAKSQVIYWFSLALALFGTANLAGVLTIHLGSAMTWVSRLALYLSGTFLLFALLGPEGKTQKQPYATKWAEAFRSNPEQVADFFSRMLDAFAYFKILMNKEGKPIDYVFIDINSAFEKLTGLNKNDILDKKASEIMNSEALEDWLNILGPVALTGEAVTLDHFSKFSRKWIHMTVYSPQKGYLVSISEDITERKKAEEALHLSEERFRIGLKNAPVSVAAQDCTLRYIWAYNQKTAKPDEIIGKLDKEIFTPDEAAHLDVIKRRVIKEGVELREQQWYNRPSGSIFLDVTWSPLRDSNGKIIGVASATIDLTDMKRIQMALQESEQRWATTLASVGDAVIATDLSGHIVFMNGKAEELTGWMLIETPLKTVKTIFKIINDQTRLEVESPIDRVLKEGIVCGLANHTVLVRKDGSEIPIDDSGAPIKDKDGKTTGVVLIFRDITERKKAEEAIRKQASLIDLSPDAIIVKKLDDTITFWSEGAQNLYGWTKEEALGKKSRSLLKTKFPEPYSVIIKALVSKGSWAGEKIHQNKFGKEIIVDSRWLASCSSQNEIDDILETNIDITERKKVEEVLKENEQLYHTVFDNSQDGFQLIELIYDKNGKPIDHKFLKINHAYESIIGVKADDILDKTARYISPNVEPGWLDIPDRVTKTGLSEHVELYNKDIGKWLDCFYFSYSKNIVGTLFRDITERKKLEKRLQDSERLAAIGATAGMVGHDIRNPLQAITSDVYLAKSDLNAMPEGEEKEELRESLEGIAKNVDYINKIVQDLQDYARPLNPVAKETNLQIVIDDILHKNGVPEQIKVHSNVQKESAILVADPDIVKRVLTNLVTNAVQAMPDGGELDIKAYQDSNDTVITVKDTGVGIPEEVKPRLFTPLFTTKSKGQGFGLVVVKRMVEAMGGTVTFESETGKGTKFIIR
ncbi:MAG TPA: PAS domain S-box protein, partial [Candidatus Nanoarchaeia archaeon]|nr:PAS domain S-box protein [Candidatus Nanoarchaeia archaeon]